MVAYQIVKVRQAFLCAFYVFVTEVNEFLYQLYLVQGDLLRSQVLHLLDKEQDLLWIKLTGSVDKVFEHTLLPFQIPRQQRCPYQLQQLNLHLPFVQQETEDVR